MYLIFNFFFIRYMFLIFNFNVKILFMDKNK